MVSVGERLRAARLEQGLSLVQAEAATKVRQHYLEALEEENFSALPPAVHTIGFLRVYAGYLGLDVQQALRTYYRDTGIVEADEELPRTQPLRSGFYLGPQLIGGLIAVVVVIGLLLYVGNQVQVFLQAQQSRQVAERAVTTPFTTPQAPLAAGAAGTPGPAPSFPPNTGVAVDVIVVERSTFLRIFVDDQKMFDGIADAGFNRVFRGNERVYVQAQDGGAVEIVMNGRRLNDRLGLRGVATDRVYSAPGR